jgi:hypothetical protein
MGESCVCLLALATHLSHPTCDVTQGRSHLHLQHSLDTCHLLTGNPLLEVLVVPASKECRIDTSSSGDPKQRQAYRMGGGALETLLKKYVWVHILSVRAHSTSSTYTPNTQSDDNTEPACLQGR